MVKALPGKDALYMHGSSMDAKKFEESFGFVPSEIKGVVEIEPMARTKKIRGRGFVAIAEQVGYCLENPAYIALSNWENETLSPEQVNVLAEDAWYTLAAGRKVSEAPDAPAEEEKAEKGEKKGKGEAKAEEEKPAKGEKKGKKGKDEAKTEAKPEKGKGKSEGKDKSSKSEGKGKGKSKDKDAKGDAKGKGKSEGKDKSSKSEGK